MRLVVIPCRALWNRRKESDGYVVILRKARRSRQTPNADLYQSRQRAHRRAPRRPNNGPHGGWREGLHRHNAGNAYRRCPSCGSCVGFALTPSPSAMKREPADAGISARRGQAMRPSQQVFYRVLRHPHPPLDFASARRLATHAVRSPLSLGVCVESTGAIVATGLSDNTDKLGLDGTYRHAPAYPANQLKASAPFFSAGRSASIASTMRPVPTRERTG